MIIGVDPHLKRLTMELGHVGVAFACHVAEPAFISSIYRDGYPVPWILLCVVVAFLAYLYHTEYDNRSKSQACLLIDPFKMLITRRASARNLQFYPTPPCPAKEDGARRTSRSAQRDVRSLQKSSGIVRRSRRIAA